MNLVQKISPPYGENECTIDITETITLRYLFFRFFKFNILKNEKGGGGNF